MGALTSTLAVCALICVAPLDAQTVSHWRPLIDEASTRFGIPVSWIERVMHAESRGQIHQAGRPIRSSAGAMGLMQLMPDTWTELRTRLRLGHDPDDPRSNILAGTFYLRLMYDRFGYPGLFAAYNAGPARYAQHLAGRRALPAETVAYLASVAPPTRKAAPVLLQMALFAVKRDEVPTGPDAASGKSSSPLFITLSGGK